MEHQKYKEALYLYSIDELSEQEKIEFENHLFQCEECTVELEALQKFNTIISENKPTELPDTVLDSARFELMKNLRNISHENLETKESLIEKIKRFFFTPFGTIAASAATLILGLAIGLNSSNINLNNPDNAIILDNLDKNKINVNNIRLIPGANDDEVEIAYDQIKPATYKGNINDKLVKELLATALVKAPNPGVRIKSLQTISEKDESQIIRDNQIKEALISAIKVDDNPGVRREAINLLKKYPYDNEVRDALIFVLLNDNNSGLRVAAINALSVMKTEGISIDDQLKSALDKASTGQETNQFVKLRAASLLKEEETK